MKKLIVVLILLAILAGVVFFFGWTQFKLDKNTYGVLYTKTHGYFDRPIRSGEFSWSPWALIPKNMDITEVPASVRTVNLEATGDLPQAELYSRVLSGDPDFSYTVELQVSYQLSGEYAVELVRDRGLEQVHIPNFLLNLDDSLQTVSQAYATEFFLNEALSRTPEQVPDALSAYLRSQLASYFPELNIQDVQTLFSSAPDMMLYEQALSSYQELMARKQEALMSALDREPQEMADHLIYLDQLESYGQLITAYPLLLDYLEIEGRYGDAPE
jgi:hypothetical protein